MNVRMRAIAVILRARVPRSVFVGSARGSAGRRRSKSSGPVITGKVYSFEKIADGV